MSIRIAAATGQREQRAKDSHQGAAGKERDEHDRGGEAQRPSIDRGNEKAALELLVEDHRDEDDPRRERPTDSAAITAGPTDRKTPMYGRTSASAGEHGERDGVRHAGQPSGARTRRRP